MALESFFDPSGTVTLVELQGSRESRGIVLASIWLQPGSRSTTELWSSGMCEKEKWGQSLPGFGKKRGNRLQR